MLKFIKETAMEAVKDFFAPLRSKRFWIWVVFVLGSTGFCAAAFNVWVNQVTTMDKVLVTMAAIYLVLDWLKDAIKGKWL